MIKAIIFDFFGVIVGDGFNVTYETAGGNPVKDKRFVQKLLDATNRGKITTDEFRSKICQKLGISVDQYNRSIIEAEIINHELLDYISELRKKYKTAILSNVNKGGLERRLDRNIIEKLFDVAIVSGEVGYIKPERQIYELTARKLRVKPEECIFIDDRLGYVQAARELGMQAIAYIDFQQMKQELEEILAVSDK